MSYGARWRDVWAHGDEQPGLRERVSTSHAVIGAEFVYGVSAEMALTLGDLLIRRSHLAFETPDQARFIAPQVANLIAPLLSWTTDDIDAALVDYAEEVKRTFAISDA